MGLIGDFMNLNTEKSISEYNEIMFKYFVKRAQEFPMQIVDRVGWSSRDTQLARFRTITKIGELQGRTVLDVGCGVGDFYHFLSSQGVNVTYTGIDLVSENCSDAQSKYSSAKFINKALFDLEDEIKYDYVIASGIFFLKYSNWDIVVEETLKKMFSLCTLGVAVNFQSAYSEPEDEISKHVYPEDIFKMITPLSKIFSVFHDYAKKMNDFTLFVYRDFPTLTG